MKLGIKLGLAGVIAARRRNVDPLAGVAGIVQRYRFADITSGVGNPIASWPNIGTQGGSATQAGTSEKPVLEADGVYFDGLDAFLGMPSLAALSQGSLFILAKNIADPPSSHVGPWLGGTGTDGGTNNHTPFSDGNIYDDFGTTARKTVGASAGILTDWATYEVSSAAGYWQAWLNGVSKFLTATNTVGFGASPTIGGDGAFYWEGHIREIIILDRASPTLDGDREIIRAYLETQKP